MKHFYSIFICLFIFFSQRIIAENVVKIPDVQWEEDNERTTTTAPKLSIDDSFLYIYSEKQLENVTISIQNTNGDIIYSIVTTIHCCQTYSIPLSSLANGEYSFLLTINNNHIFANILINN